MKDWFSKVGNISSLLISYPKKKKNCSCFPTRVDRFRPQVQVITDDHENYLFHLFWCLHYFFSFLLYCTWPHALLEPLGYIFYHTSTVPDIIEYNHMSFLVKVSGILH